MSTPLSAFPSVDRVLHWPAVQRLIEQHGRASVLETVRALLDKARHEFRNTGEPTRLDEGWFETHGRARLDAMAQPSLRPVFNLTGTVLHTNLGRALLPVEAQQAVLAVMSQPGNLEYDLVTGGRGDRDDHVENLLCSLTGAEAATVVNNNAAAVFLVLNTLALKREVPVSRGELVEIGGAFRIPDIMMRAGCDLIEVGTTNRTHLKDFAGAINPQTAMLMKVHASNYAIQGFIASVPENELAALAHDSGLPFVVDLGSGTLVDLKRWGLPGEPTPQEALANGADLVTFSGDKLLGGPQAGIVVGRKDLVQAVKQNPLKRALRVGKMTIAALEAVLRLYRDPDRLSQKLTTLRLLTRSTVAIEATAGRVKTALEGVLSDRVSIAIKPCQSQIGSGSLPVELLPSACLAMGLPSARRPQGSFPEKLAAAFRALPTPVIGRIADGEFRLDLRCLEDEQTFISQLKYLSL